MKGKLFLEDPENLILNSEANQDIIPLDSLKKLGLDWGITNTINFLEKNIRMKIMIYYLKIHIQG